MSIKIKFSDTLRNSDFLLSEVSYYMEKLFQLSVEETKHNEDILIELKKDSSDKDQIVIDFSQGKGFIQANSEAGVLIAVYKLFYAFGVRFLRPGRESEFIPELSSEEFCKEIKFSEKASYKHRGVCIEGADSFQNVKDFIDWLPKIGMNTFFIQFENPYSFFKRWYEHEFNPYIETEPFSSEIAQKMSDRIDQEIEFRGLFHHRVGHGWTSEVLGYSSKYGWESGLTLPKEKESLVAQLEGERGLFNSAPILTSLDFANPDVGKKMVALIVEYAKERKDVDYLHVWLSDARNNICECEKCKKDLPSEQYVRILNALDEALTEEGLDTKICFLLYHELLFAPQKETLNNEERFTLMFAPITRTFEMSYADVDYNEIPDPQQYIRNKIVLPNSLEENLSYLFSWQQNFKGDSFVYDYPLGRAHYGDLGYMKISKVIYRDVQYLNELNLNGYVSCQELRAGFPHNLPNYIMGQTLWNKDLNYDEIKQEYFEALYGKEWQCVIDYLEKLSEFSSCDHFNAIGPRVDEKLAIKYQISVNTAKEFLKSIEKNIAENIGLQKDAWLQLSYHREYVIKIGTALQLLSIGKYEEAQSCWRDFLDYIRRNEKQIQPNLDVYRVIEVAKNYAGFEL